MENKKDSLGKTKKQPSKIFATNFFASLYFLNESLINNKSIGVSNKQCTETLKENTLLLPEESVKSPRERHKSKSLSQKINILSSKETAIKHITSTEEKHQTNDNEIISVQNWGNDESFGETVIKENRKGHKHESALKEHDIVAQKDMSLELSGKSIMNKNEFTSLESVQSVTNLGILSEECIKEKKKQSKVKSAFLEIDHQNIAENEENIEDADLIGLINKVKKKYENERKSLKADVKMALKFLTNDEENQKEHKMNFDEYDYESTSAQNEENFKVLDDTVIKEKKKRHKNKSAFKEHNILSPKDTSLEVLDENVKHKSKFFEESVQNVTNGAVLSEDLVKEKKKHPKPLRASTEFDNESFFRQNEKNVKTANLIKQKTDQTEFSDIAEDNDNSIQEDHVKKKKKHKRRNADIEKEEKDYTLLENINSIQEDVVKKKKKHKRRKADIEKEEKDNALSEKINSIQEDVVKKKKKHKRRNVDIEKEEKDNALLEKINYIQEDLVKKKKKHKRRNADIEKEEKDNALLEKINSIQEDLVKKKKKHKRGNADLEKEEKDNALFEYINSIQEDLVKKKKKHKRRNADIEKEEKDNALLEKINSIQEDLVKKKKKHKRRNADIEKEEKDNALLEKINSIQEDVVKKKKKHKMRNADIEKEEEGNALFENINAIQEDVVKKKKKHKRRNANIEKEEKDNALFENINSIQDLVKEKKKHKRKNADIEKEEKDNALLEKINSIQEDLVKKKKKHKRKKSNIEEDNYIILEDINSIHEDPVKKKKKHKTKNSEVAENNDLMENVNAIFVKKKKKHKRKNSDIAEENGASLIENVDSIQEGHVEKKKYKRGFSEILEDDENLDFTLKDSVKKMKKLNMELHTLVQVKNNVKNNDFGSEKPIKGKRQKYKLFAADEYLALQSHANIEFANNKEMEQKGKSKYFSFNDQIHKTQNNVGFDLSDNKKKKEVANLEQLIQQSSDEESENCLTNSQQTMTIIQNEKNVMTSKLIKKKKKDQTEFYEVREDNDTSLLKNIDLAFQDNPAKKKKKHKRKNSDVENKDKDTIVLENENSIQKDLGKKCDIKEDNDTILLENKNSIQEDPVKMKKQRRKEKREEESRFKDENKSMPTRLNSEDEEDEILLQGTPLSIDVSDLDLNEDPVDFEIPLLHSHERACQLKLEEKEALKSQGVVIKTGKFTAYEVSLLKRNYNEFTKRFQINDPQILLGIGQTSRKKDVMAFLRAKHFYVRLGKDLPDRQLFTIYRKARILFHHLKKETKLDKEDVNRIRKAHSRMGSKWQAIGNIIDKSADTARQAFLWHDKSINRGRWTAEEEDQLISAIKTVTGKTDLSNIEIEGAILWEKVADLVPSRNCHQCRCHWNEHLSCKFKTVCWNKKDFGKLVSILRKEFYVDDFVYINWREVQKCFGDISWQFLRKKWYLLASMFRDLKKDYSKVIPYKKILDYYCIVYNIKTN
ncbi:hypothetical protein JTE90_013320 [Oedothorax gibbosus]|uniref:Transcription termination factor 1 n=1 Tax=Oedothorax gibbosus TaxID=931172 RepID=A0AAV6VEZ2_9ARAC|nr:hypothetical protein JTE90_013320 [Oedothorax gibbosus]